tara:strand:- start:1457 stop:1978 length:522 start_codon:yes stop_codon:yes gene_type:complete
MKNKIIISSVTFFFIFCFFVFFKGLNNSNIYIPDDEKKYVLNDFRSKDLFTNQFVDSKEIFKDSEFYILNIWASWCLPCRDEHPILMEIKKTLPIKIVGLNYKDNTKNAKEFINKNGNPFSKILLDEEGTISISLGAYGVPETFLLNNKREVLKKFIGPLSVKSLQKINEILQ